MRTMLFASYLGTIEAVARLGENATVGNVQKMNLTLSVGQVARLLKQLETEGYMHHKVVPYGRTGKKVYYLSNLCVTNICITADAFVQAGYIADEAVAS